MIKKKWLAYLLILSMAGLTGCNQETLSSSISSSGSIEDSSSSSEVLPTGLEIKLNGENITEAAVSVGETLQLSAVISPENAVSTITWSSSDTSLASVSNEGLVTGINPGTAIIKASLDNGISKSCFINIKEKVGQKGVGTGLSEDDPIYIGNEGEDEPLQIYFIETLQIYSDAIFIKKGNVEILIDAGYPNDGNYISDFIKEKCTDGRLDALLVSHSDGDHVDGLPNALKDVDNLSLMVDYGGLSTGKVGEIREKYIPTGTHYHSAWDSVNFTAGASNRYYLTDDFYFDVLDTGNYVENTASGASNAHSLAVLFTYKDFTFFTGGDLTSSSETDLMRNVDLPQVTLFKAHHHGSSGSNSQGFLNQINPKYVAIAASRASKYGGNWTKPTQNDTYNLDATNGHPAAEAVERIFKAPSISNSHNVYWNAINGTMCFSTYGENDCSFQGSKTRKGYYDLTLTGGVPVWDETIQDFKNRVEGEENLKFSETKAFKFRGYDSFLA